MCLPYSFKMFMCLHQFVCFPNRMVINTKLRLFYYILPEAKEIWRQRSKIKEKGHGPRPTESDLDLYLKDPT